MACFKPVGALIFLSKLLVVYKNVAFITSKIR